MEIDTYSDSEESTASSTEDITFNQSGDSGTEQEATDEEDEGLRESSQNLIFGKDGTAWECVPPRANTRTRTENIMNVRPGVNSEFKHHKTVLDCWKIFISDSMLSQIVENTNIEIRLQRDKAGKTDFPAYANYITQQELSAVLGLLYIAGLYHCNRTNLEDLWRSDGTGVDIFRMTMTLKRFMFIHNNLRFDDKNTREERKKQDNMTAICEVMDLFVDACKRAYSSSPYVTIDEQLYTFRGKCSFKVYIPSKPRRYGLKVFAIVDAESFYVLALEMYAGKQPEGPFAISNKPFDVVDRLVSVVSKTRRNVTFDNWFTSIPLMIHLLKHHKLTSTGTVRKNKREIPTNFVKCK